MAFYQCRKCKRTWQYLLPLCPYCFEELKEMEAEKAHVISISKVNIPTLFHPNVPYFILLLQDNNGNIWAHKSLKEYKEGDEFKTETGFNKDAVAVWRVKYNLLEAVKKAFDLLGNTKLGVDSKVLILPSLDAPTHYYFRDNTSPEFLTATLNFLMEAGVKTENIKVASQSFNELPIGASAQKSGLLKVCGKFNITPIDLAVAAFNKSSDGKYEIAGDVLWADLILNLPILKIGQASATQNLFKVLKKENYLGLKYLESEKEITQFFAKLGDKVITIAEAENVQRPNKLTVFLGLILASRDPMNLDRVFNEITQASQLPEILKDIKIENIPVTGRSIKEVQYQAEIF